MREENKNTKVELETKEEETKRLKELFRKRDSDHNATLKEIKDKETNFDNIVA